jgi:hypothetical protein
MFIIFGMDEESDACINFFGKVKLYDYYRTAGQLRLGFDPFGRGFGNWSKCYFPTDEGV